MRGSGLQWSFPGTTAAASPQILSFKSAQERGGGGGGATPKLYPYPSFSQRNLGLDKQGGGGSQHHWQHGDSAHPAHNPHEVRIFPSAAAATATAALSSSVLPSHLVPNGGVGPMMGTASPMSSVSVPPSNCPVVGSTDLRNSSSISTGPCQLTIFYNGSVCVYDNVSPEKAQAIMLLAGNGDSTNSSASAAPSTAPKVQQPTVPRPPANDTAIPNQSLGFSSSVSLPTSGSSLPPVASNCATEVNAVVKPVVAPAHVKCPEPLKSGAPVEAGGTHSISSVVPQARKASLARFLEKRKERVIGASPYGVSKNSSEFGATGPRGSTFATNSTSSSPVRAST